MKVSRVSLIWPLLAVACFTLDACSKDPTSTPTGTDDPRSDGGERRDASEPGQDEDASEDAGARTDARSDAEAGSCGPIVTTAGETCVGFGPSSETCDPGCGQPYGYVCFEGAPPAFESCRLVSDTVLGQTYCCTKNDCVAQPDQDTMCSGSPATPRRYQCPPKGPDAGNVAPPVGCVEKGSGETKVEKFYCCP